MDLDCNNYCNKLLQHRAAVRVSVGVSVEVAVRGHVRGPSEQQLRLRADLATQPLKGSYHPGDHGSPSDDLTEWILPVRWLVTVPAAEAYWERGDVRQPDGACKLQEFTLARLTEHFHPDEQD